MAAAVLRPLACEHGSARAIKVVWERYPSFRIEICYVGASLLALQLLGPLHEFPLGQVQGFDIESLINIILEYVSQPCSFPIESWCHSSRVDLMILHHTCG